MSRTHTPPRLSAWRERYDARAKGVYQHLPEQLRVRLRRLGYAFIPVLQCGIAAGLAWFVAHDLLGHTRPFFAPIAAVISLGAVTGKRLRRGFELVAGVVVGIAVGDLIILLIGSGPWQIAMVVVLAMSVALFVDDGVLVHNQAGASAVLVATLLPPGDAASLERPVDALVGGLMGIVLMALVPIHPVTKARREAGALLGVCASVVHDTAEGLRTSQTKVIADALQAARDTQPSVDELRSLVAGGREVTQISPLHFRQRDRVGTLEAVLNPLDNAVRNIRVLSRRAIVAVEDQIPVRVELIEAIGKLGGALEVVREMALADPGDSPTPGDATRALRSVAVLTRAELAEGASLTEAVLLAQVRSVVVDMMQVCGMSKISSLATLPPTVATPLITPEEWEPEQWEPERRAAPEGDQPSGKNQ